MRWELLDAVHYIHITFLPFQNPTVARIAGLLVLFKFQLQEYISLLMRLDVNSVVSSPEKKRKKGDKEIG